MHELIYGRSFNGDQYAFNLWQLLFKNSRTFKTARDQNTWMAWCKDVTISLFCIEPSKPSMCFPKHSYRISYPESAIGPNIWQRAVSNYDELLVWHHTGLTAPQFTWHTTVCSNHILANNKREPSTLCVIGHFAVNQPVTNGGSPKWKKFRSAFMLQNHLDCSIWIYWSVNKYLFPELALLRNSHLIHYI